MERSQRILVLGALQVLLGCVVGLIPPPAVLHFRSIVTAHIEYCVNGILLCVIGLLIPRMKLSGFMFAILELSGIIGTFTNGTAFLIAAFTGCGTELAPTINEKFPTPNGVNGAYSPFITGTLMVCAVTIIASMSVAIIGLVSYNPSKTEKSH